MELLLILPLCHFALNDCAQENDDAQFEILLDPESLRQLWISYPIPHPSCWLYGWEGVVIRLEVGRVSWTYLALEWARWQSCRSQLLPAPLVVPTNDSGRLLLISTQRLIYRDTLLMEYQLLGPFNKSSTFLTHLTRNFEPIRPGPNRQPNWNSCTLPSHSSNQRACIDMKNVPTTSTSHSELFTVIPFAFLRFRQNIITNECVFKDRGYLLLKKWLKTELCSGAHCPKLGGHDLDTFQKLSKRDDQIFRAGFQASSHPCTKGLLYLV